MGLRPEQLSESARALYDDFVRSGMFPATAIKRALEGDAARRRTAVAESTAGRPVPKPPEGISEAEFCRALGLTNVTPAKEAISESTGDGITVEAFERALGIDAAGRARRIADGRY